MSYARNVLEKFGWREGKGLGKNESGMVEALKPKLKFDTTGIGHDHAQQFTFNWWEIAFNDAAKRVSVNPSKNNSFGQLNTNTFCISTKPPSVTKLMKETPLIYGNFIKTETLKNGGEVVPVLRKSTTAAEDSSRITWSTLSDDELFKICGGRTAHKAARHGHNLVGKLARVIEQEKQQLSASGGSGKEKEDYLRVKTNGNVVVDGGEHIRSKKKRKKKLVEVENEKNIYEQLATDNEVIKPSALEIGVARDGNTKGNKKRKKKKMVLDVEVTSRLKVCSEGSKSKKKKRCKSECNHLKNDNSEQITNDKRYTVCEEHIKRRSKKKRR